MKLKYLKQQDHAHYACSSSGSKIVHCKDFNELIHEKVMGSFYSKQTEPEQTRFKTVFTIQKCVAQNLTDCASCIMQPRDTVLKIVM